MGGEGYFWAICNENVLWVRALLGQRELVTNHIVEEHTRYPKTRLGIERLQLVLFAQWGIGIGKIPTLVANYKKKHPRYG